MVPAFKDRLCNAVLGSTLVLKHICAPPIVDSVMINNLGVRNKPGLTPVVLGRVRAKQPFVHRIRARSKSWRGVSYTSTVGHLRGIGGLRRMYRAVELIDHCRTSIEAVPNTFEPQLKPFNHMWRLK